MKNIILAVAICALGNLASAQTNEENLAAKLREGQVLIGVFEIMPSTSKKFTHTFTEQQIIGFSSDISWDEMNRFKKEENRSSSVELRQTGTDHYVGSHFGASIYFQPGNDAFELYNYSREDLTITVYYEPE